MNIPGFGATASLYNASTYYCLANAWPSVAGTHFGAWDLTPQAGIQPAGIHPSMWGLLLEPRRVRYGLHYVPSLS